MALCSLCGPYDQEVAQTLKKDVVDCIRAEHNDADLWMLAWNRVGKCIAEGLNIRVVWAKGHTALEEKAKMSLENHQAWAVSKTDEFAKTGAAQDGAEVAERVAKEALDTRKKVHAAVRYAATFHNEVEGLVNMEEIKEEKRA